MLRFYDEERGLIRKVYEAADNISKGDAVAIDGLVAHRVIMDFELFAQDCPWKGFEVGSVCCSLFLKQRCGDLDVVHSCSERNCGLWYLKNYK